MKPQVVAVVVCHDSDDYLKSTLEAIARQTRPVDSLILIDTGEQATTLQPMLGSKIIKLPSKTNLAVSLNTAASEIAASENTWMWIIHDDSAPEQNCLEELLRTEEQSALAGAIGPKQVRWDNPRYIWQQGLTLTPFGTPISLVNNELDQSQHDSQSDVLAVSTTGLLIRSDIWQQVGGANEKTPPLALDYELSLRVKLAGLRVMVAPRARVRHAALSLNSKRSRGWLRGSTKVALRKASIHLRMQFTPIYSALLFWFFLPLITLGRIFWRILQKRPDRVWSELVSGIWGYFTIFARFAGRPKGADKQVQSIRKALQAPWPLVRAVSRKVDDQAEAALLQKEFDSGAIAPRTKTFTEAGGWFFAIALLAVSYLYFPTGQAVTGALVKPLSGSWWQLFTHAGSSWQSLGGGVALPAEPFNWALLLLGTFTFWSPSLAVGLFLFIAPALAFAGAWRTAALLSSKAWVRNFAATGFALWPGLIAARADGSVAQLIAGVTAPWLAFTLARAAGVGRSGSARSMRQTWSWVGISGLLFAIVGVSSPILVLPALLLLAVVTLTRINRTGYLFWVPLPFAALFFPQAFQLVVGQLHPLALFADPSLNAASNKLTISQLFIPTDFLFGWGYLIWFVLALLALLTRRWILAAALWCFALVLVVLVYFHVNTWFVYPSQYVEGYVNGSPNAIMSVIGLVLISVFALLAENMKRWATFIVAPVVLLVGILPTAVMSATSKPHYSFSDSRVVPWLLQAAASSGANLNTLVVTPAADGLYAEVVPVSGTHLEDANVAYRYALAELEKSERFISIAELTAQLSSGNAVDLSATLSQNHISYVLLRENRSDGGAQVALALNAQPNLDAAGQTEFGALWRVTSTVAAATPDSDSPWSITKITQLTIIVAFVLLAMPTAATRKRKAEANQVFIESEGDV